jgi:hypothetical protein
MRICGTSHQDAVRTQLSEHSVFGSPGRPCAPPHSRPPFALPKRRSCPSAQSLPRGCPDIWEQGMNLLPCNHRHEAPTHLLRIRKLKTVELNAEVLERRLVSPTAAVAAPEQERDVPGNGGRRQGEVE